VYLVSGLSCRPLSVARPVPLVVARLPKHETLAPLIFLEPLLTVTLNVVLLTVRRNVCTWNASPPSSFWPVLYHLCVAVMALPE
jgi:hypothetical protein